MQQNPMIYQLYAVTAPAADLAEQVKRAIAGGITMLQIREKNCTTKRRIELAYPILQLCRDAGIPCIIDDDAEAAKILGADGVHVGQRDMKIQQAREILGDQAIIGTSAHNVAAGGMSSQTAAICCFKNSAGTGQMPCTPSVFCAVSAVMALMPKQPSMVMVFRSA